MVLRLSPSVTLALVAAFALAAGTTRDTTVRQRSSAAIAASCNQINPPPPPSCYSVSVTTADNNPTVTRTPYTAGYKDTFVVHNTGNADTYTIACAVAGPVTCDSTNTSAVTGPSPTKVVAYYRVGAPGNGTLTLTATGTYKASSAFYSVPVWTYGVTVTPLTGPEPARVPNTGGYKVAFAVRDTGSGSDTFQSICSTSSNVTCRVVSPTSLALTGGASGTVTVAYSVGTAATGWLTLKALGIHSDSSQGSYTVPVGQAAGAPVVDVTPYNYAKQDYRRCSVDCFATVYKQSTVPYFSSNTPRNVILSYNSDRVYPRPFVHINVSPDPTYGQTPTEYRLQVKVNGALVRFVNGDSTLRFSYAGSAPVRLGGQLDTSSSYAATNVYPLDIIVTALYVGGPVTTDIPTKLVVVNQTNAPIAGGWNLAGVQRLYPQSDTSALITEGDGSAAYFWNVGGTLVSPGGEFSALVPSTLSGSSGWARLYPDSTKAVFDNTGRLVQMRDRFNNITTIVYDGSGRVWQIKDPINLALTLSYGANGLGSIQDPGTPARTTTVSVNGSRQLTAITDPDNVSTNFVFDATLLLSRVIDRRGDTTQFSYDNGSRKMVHPSSPAVSVFGSANPVSLTETHNSWQLVGVPYASTVVTPATAPRADTVHASLIDARGYTSALFTVDRWGEPTQTTDALGHVTAVSRDTNGLATRIVYPTGGVDSMAYNASGLPTFIQPAGRSPISISYYAFLPLTGRYEGGWGQPVVISSTGEPSVNNYLGPNGQIDTTVVGGQAQTKYTYDAFGRLLSATDPEGHLVVQHTYAGTNGNLSRDSVPGSGTGNRVITYFQDSYGRDTAVQLPGGLPIRRTRYDILNRPTASYHGVNADSTVTAYDSLFVRSVTDPKGQVYGFTHNALGWLTQRTDPSGQAVRYSYDGNHNLRRMYNRRGDSLAYDYDAQNRFVNKSGSNTSAKSRSYSPNGLIITNTSAIDTETVYLTLGGQVDSVNTKLAGQTYWRRYRYTAAGLLDSMDISGGGIAFRPRKYVYDSLFGNLITIRLSGTPTTAVPNKDGQDTSFTLPGGDQLKKSYYALHGLAEISSSAPYGTTIARDVSYDALGRVTRQVNGGKAVAYAYDGLRRLAAESLLTETDQQVVCQGRQLITSSGSSCVSQGSWHVDSVHTFAYDSVGNRNDKSGAYITGNRISTFGGCNYATDVDGNVTSRSCGTQTTTFYWATESRLDSLTVGSQRVEFKYDAVGRLVRKDLNGTPWSYYLWDGSNLLAELTSTGTGELAEYSYYPGQDNPHALIVGGRQYSAHVDALGNVIALTDSSQTVQRTYSYDAWGNTTGGSDTRPFANVDRPRWKGALWLGPEVELYYMRSRWYEPQTGRFLSEDPLGVGAGINPYAFAMDDPVNSRDAFGKCPGNLDPTGATYDQGGVTYYCSDGSSYYVAYNGGYALTPVTVDAPAPMNQPMDLCAILNCAPSTTGSPSGIPGQALGAGTFGSAVSRFVGACAFIGLCHGADVAQTLLDGKLPGDIPPLDPVPDTSPWGDSEVPTIGEDGVESVKIGEGEGFDIILNILRVFPLLIMPRGYIQMMGPSAPEA